MNLNRIKTECNIQHYNTRRTNTKKKEVAFTRIFFHSSLRIKLFLLQKKKSVIPSVVVIIYLHTHPPLANTFPLNVRRKKAPYNCLYYKWNFAAFTLRMRKCLAHTFNCTTKTKTEFFPPVLKRYEYMSVYKSSDMWKITPTTVIRLVCNTRVYTM